MSGIFGNGKNTQVLDFKNKKARAESVLDAIVGSHGVMVVCGPGTLGQSGIQVNLSCSRGIVTNLNLSNCPPSPKKLRFGWFVKVLKPKRP